MGRTGVRKRWGWTISSSMNMDRGSNPIPGSVNSANATRNASSSAVSSDNSETGSTTRLPPERRKTARPGPGSASSQPGGPA